MAEEKKFPFENLVFEGGGVLGVAYQGAFEVLEERGISKNIKRVCGTSAGTISSTMIALGYTGAECRKVLLNAPFNSFKDGGFFGIFRMLFSYGWYKGDKLKDFYEKLVSDKTGSKHTTFRELNERGYMDLRLVATNVSKDTVLIFSHKHTPDVCVAEAMRMSSSVPFFFQSQKFKGDIFIDGGVLCNYAIDEFDDICKRNQTLGFFLQDPKQTPQPINGIFTFAERFLEALKNQQYIQLMNEREDIVRTVFIDDLGIKALQFGITIEQRKALMEQGRIATEKYLEDWKHWE
jgi:NTE family protein